METAETDLVSICVPIYNGEKYLPESLQSIVNQTYQNLEIIFLDDQSNDGSADIIKSFAKTDQRVKLFSNPENLGLVHNWNECFKKATGRWIKFHFQDDLMETTTIEKMITLIYRTKKKVVLCDRSYFKSSENTSVRFRKKHRHLKDYLSENQEIVRSKEMVRILNSNFLKNNLIGEPIVGLIGQEIVNKYGVFDTEMHQIVDLEYWLRICSNEDIAFLNEPLVKFRVHNQSQTFRNRTDPGALSRRLLDRFYLVNKLFRDEHFSQYRKLSSEGSPLEDLRKRLYSSLIKRAGYFTSKKMLPKDARKQMTWSVIFAGIIRDLQHFISRVRNIRRI